MWGKLCLSARMHAPDMEKTCSIWGIYILFACLLVWVTVQDTWFACLHDSFSYHLLACRARHFYSQVMLCVWRSAWPSLLAHGAIPPILASKVFSHSCLPCAWLFLTYCSKIALYFMPIDFMQAGCSWFICDGVAHCGSRGLVLSQWVSSGLVALSYPVW